MVANKKRPGDWAGKRVLVVGFGNTAADIACELAGTADKVYLSHRNGSIVVSYKLTEKFLSKFPFKA